MVYWLLEKLWELNARLYALLLRLQVAAEGK